MENTFSLINKSLSSKALETSKQLLLTQTENFKKKLSESTVKINSTPKDIQSIVTRHLPYMEEITQTTQTKFLESAKKKKGSLEEELIRIENSIVFLTNTPLKHELSPKELKKRYQEEDIQKKKQFKKLKNRLESEKKARLLELDKLRQSSNARLLKEIEEINKKEEEIKQKAQEERQNKLKKLHEKALMRKKEQEEIKNRKFISYHKPFYLKIEEKYRETVELPEIEHRKAELARNKLKFKSISPLEIKEHIKKHKQISADLERKRKRAPIEETIESSIKTSPSKSMIDYLNRQQLIEEEQKIKAQKLIELKKKQKQYSLLIKEMFIPRISPRKALEVLQSIEKTKKKRPERSPPRNKTFSPVKRVHNYTPVIREPPSVPKNYIKVDYLLERRKKRNEKNEMLMKSYQENFNTERSCEENSRSRASKLEEEAYKREMLVRSVSPNDPRSLVLEEQANSLLLQAIQAKINLLN